MSEGWAPEGTIALAVLHARARRSTVVEVDDLMRAALGRQTGENLRGIQPLLPERLSHAVIGILAYAQGLAAYHDNAADALIDALVMFSETGRRVLDAEWGTDAVRMRHLKAMARTVGEETARRIDRVSRSGTEQQVSQS